MIISNLSDKLIHRWTRGDLIIDISLGVPNIKTRCYILQRESDIACDHVHSMQTVASVRKHCVSNKSSDKSFVHDIRAAQVKLCPVCTNKPMEGIFRCTLGSQAHHAHCLEDHTLSIQQSTSTHTKHVHNIQQQNSNNTQTNCELFHQIIYKHSTHKPNRATHKIQGYNITLRSKRQ